MAVVRCAGKRIPLCQDPCPSCGSCSTPCGCSNNGVGGTNNGGNGTNNGYGGTMPFIFAPMQAPAPIIINSPAAAPAAAACPQPIIVFTPPSVQQQAHAADPVPNSQQTNQGQTMPGTSIDSIVPGAGAATTTTSSTPVGSTTSSNNPGQGGAQNTPAIGGIVPSAGSSTQPTSVVPIPDSPAPTGNQQSGSDAIVPSPAPSGGTIPLPASSQQPKSLSADNGSNPNQPSNVNGQPIIINITNSQDRDSNNRSAYSPEILDSYNREGSQPEPTNANAIRVRQARLVPGRRVRLMRQTPVSEVSTDQPTSEENNSQKSYHYVGWS